MSESSRDTSPDAAQVQLELLRAAGAARRGALMRSLSRTLIAASRREIARTNPEGDARAQELRWIELAYGRDLRDALARYLDSRSR